MKERNLTCIVCPKGCQIKVFFDGEGKIKEVLGYTCKRGEEYAITECTHPRRTVTTTMKTAGGIVAVKTYGTVPKEDVFKVMDEINRTRITRDVKIGDVLIEDVAGTGVKVVATSEVQ